MDSTTFIDNLLVQKGDFSLSTFAAYDAEKVMETVCAFLNNRGGWIVIGIDDKWMLTAVDAQETVADIQMRAASQIKPLPLLYVHKEPYKEGEVVLLTMMKGGLPPYSYRGRYYVEQYGEATEPDRDDISILLRNSSLASNWERATHVDAEWDDLDEALMAQVVKSGHDNDRLGKETQTAEALLGGLGLKDIGYVKNGAVALFAQNAEALLHQCRLRIQVMLGGKSANRYEDTCELKGNLFNLLDQVHDYFVHRLPMASAFSDTDWDRKNSVAFPLDVVDEAVTNALIHRDFSNVSDEVLVYIYADRMEVINPGEMPKDLVRRKYEVLPHISTPRNPLMAEIFFIADKMEKTGRGMKLIHDGMEALGVRLPEWENRNGRTKLTVYRTAFVRKLNERIAAFISARKVGEVFTKKDYMASVPDMTEATAKKDLAMMVEQRLCRKEGAGPSSHYVVLDKK